MDRPIRSDTSSIAKVSVDVITTEHGFDQLRSDWERLTGSDADATVFSSWQWLREWWRVCGEEHDLRVIVIRQDGKTTGIAPLMITRGSIMAPATLHFIGFPDTDYADFIGADKPTIASAALQCIAAQTDWQTVSLSQIPEGSGSIEAVQEFVQRYGGRAFLERTDPCLTFVFGDSESERRDFHIKRSKSLRNQINFFAKRGGLEIELLADVDTILEHLPRFFQYHIARWRDTPTPSYFRFPGPRALFEGLVRSLAPMEKLFLAVLVSGGKPVAYFLCFRDERTAYLYTPAHNPFFEKRSPGKVLNYLLLEKLVAEGYNVIDYTRGGEQYKLSLTNRETLNYTFTVYRRGWEKLVRSLYATIKEQTPVKRIITLPRVQRLKKSAASVYGEKGPTGIVRTLLSGIGQFFWQRRVIYRISLQDPPTVDPGDNFRELFVEDLERMATLAHFSERADISDKYAQRFEQGWRAFGSFDGDCLQAFAWFRYTTTSSPRAIIEDLHTSEIRGRAVLGLRLLLNTAARVIQDAETAEFWLSDADGDMAASLRDKGFRLESQTTEISVCSTRIFVRN